MNWKFDTKCGWLWLTISENIWNCQTLLDYLGNWFSQSPVEVTERYLQYVRHIVLQVSVLTQVDQFWVILEEISNIWDTFWGWISCPLFIYSVSEEVEATLVVNNYFYKKWHLVLLKFVTLFWQTNIANITMFTK